MAKEKLPNNIKASNLILITAGLSLINYLLVGPFTTLLIVAFIIIVVIIVVLGLLAQQGYSWFKWVYLGLLFLGLMNVFHTLPLAFQASLISGCIATLTYILQIIAIIFLFLPPKKSLH